MIVLNILKITFVWLFNRPPSSEYVCNKMDDTWSIVFDTLNSTFNELLYYKFGDCDDHGYGRYQEIMFDDMNNNELQVYNEELLNRLQSPLDGTHLDCFYLFNKKASVNDTRLTKIETYLCSNSNDCSMKLCDDNPDYFKCKHLELVGSRLGFDYIGWSYQRQEDDQVCITYTDYTPNKYQQYACYSFCMNVGEETKVFFGNEFQIVRVSDKNDTVFTTVEVYVTRRYDSKYDPNLEDDDMYGPDDDYLYPSYQPTTILWLHTLSKFESQLEDDDMYFGLDEIHDDFKLDEVHDDYTDRELGDDEYLNDPLSYSIDDDNCLRDDDILGHHYHGYLGENCYPNYHHHETNNQSFITSSPIMFGFVLGFGIFSSVFGSLYIIKFLKRRKSLRGGDLFEISDLEMMEEDRSGQKEEGNAEII